MEEEETEIDIWWWCWWRENNRNVVLPVEGNPMWRCWSGQVGGQAEHNKSEREIIKEMR